MLMLFSRLQRPNSLSLSNPILESAEGLVLYVLINKDGIVRVRRGMRIFYVLKSFRL